MNMMQDAEAILVSKPPRCRNHLMMLLVHYDRLNVTTHSNMISRNHKISMYTFPFTGRWSISKFIPGFCKAMSFEIFCSRVRLVYKCNEVHSYFPGTKGHDSGCNNETIRIIRWWNTFFLGFTLWILACWYQLHSRFEQSLAFCSQRGIQSHHRVASAACACSETCLKHLRGNTLVLEWDERQPPQKG